MKLGRGTTAKGAAKREADPDFDTPQPRKRRSTRDSVAAQPDEGHVQQVGQTVSWGRAQYMGHVGRFLE